MKTLNRSKFYLDEEVRNFKQKNNMTTEEKKELIKKSFDDFIDKVDLLSEEEVIKTGIHVISILDFKSEEDTAFRILGDSPLYLLLLLLNPEIDFG